MKIVILLAMFSSVFFGCSSTSKLSLPPPTALLPPEKASWPINQQLFEDRDFESIDLFLSRVINEDPSPNTIWWADYRRAQLWTKKDKNVSCEIFVRLAMDPKFPLQRLSFLRAHQYCPSNNQVLQRLGALDLTTFDDWLQRIAIDAAVARAEQTNDTNALVKLYVAQSKQNLRKEEKVSLVKKALELAGPSQRQEIMARLVNLSPKEIRLLTPKDYLDAANDFRYFRQFDRAEMIYKKMIANKKISTTDKIQALKALRQNFRVQQKRKEALAVTEQQVAMARKLYPWKKAKTAEHKIIYEAELQLARTQWTEDQTKQALKTIGRMEKQFASLLSIHEAIGLRGRILEEQKEFAKALVEYKRALDLSSAFPVYKSRMAWMVAWMHRKLLDFDEAEKSLRTLVARAESGFERSKLQFWLAKTLLDKNDPESAKAEFEAIVKNDPFSFYGYLAHRELNLELPLILDSADNDDSSREVASLPTAQLANYRWPTALRENVDRSLIEWLIATREDEAANSYLNEATIRIKKLHPNNQDAWTTLFAQYIRSHNFLPMLSQLGTLPTALRRSLVEENPTLLFPTPYEETVQKTSNRFGVAPEFIYAIIRQESSFNVTARSPMDAFGLMQVLPQVAKGTAERNDLDYKDEQSLYEPHIIIPIGAAHLRELLERYDHEYVLAIANYNAREEAIQSWIKNRYRGDVLEFIEDIPYDETRDYVKLVIRNLVTYRSLAIAPQRMRFPEEYLKLNRQMQP
jgi:soluble lytic murein transglycosylase